MSEPNRPDALGARFAALPSFEPAPALWSRIESARPRPIARLWPGLAAAAALAAVAIGIATFWRAPVDAGAYAARLEQARVLEAELVSARALGVSNPDVLVLERELAAADRALQSAYDRRAASHELETLWRARVDRLAALLIAYRHSESLVRI